MKLLDLYCGAGGCSEGYRRAGFEVTGVDSNPRLARLYRGGHFVLADALEYVREHGHEYDAIHASPPCQAHSSLKALQPGKAYPDLIPATRAALQASGKPYVIENVPRAPLGGGDTYLLMLCGTMFGCITPDGRAEIQRHRLFETNWCFGLRPACQHNGPALQVAGENFHSGDRCAHCGHAREEHAGDPEWGDRAPECDSCSCAGFVEGRDKQRRVLSLHGDHPRDARVRHARRAMSVTGGTPQTNVVHNQVRETFSVADARAAMGIDWMPMKYLSQAIPPAYTHWIGRRLLDAIGGGR